MQPGVNTCRRMARRGGSPGGPVSGRAASTHRYVVAPTRLAARRRNPRFASVVTPARGSGCRGGTRPGSRSPGSAPSRGRTAHPRAAHVRRSGGAGARRRRFWPGHSPTKGGIARRNGARKRAAGEYRNAGPWRDALRRLDPIAGNGDPVDSVLIAGIPAGSRACRMTALEPGWRGGRGSPVRGVCTTKEPRGRMAPGSLDPLGADHIILADPFRIAPSSPCT